MVLDFAVCAGLGVAAVSCAIAAAVAVRASTTGATTKATSAAVGILAFVVFGGALLAIAAILGETKASRDPNSTLGFVVGASVVSIAFYAAVRRRT
ncbi:MAG TPA: hypothetical protein PKV56_12865 [Burkholderiaceae bacterium]|nr:hypothetical protein [Burkholderiaceae bacterium]